MINFNFFQDGNILPLSHLASPALSLSLHEWLNTVTCPVNVGLCFDIINAMLQLCAALYESSSAGEYASVALTRHRRIVRSVPTDFQLILSICVRTQGTHESAIRIISLECISLRHYHKANANMTAAL